MPFFASFENIDLVAPLLVALLLLPVAAGCTLIALILAFWRRTRFVSMSCAVACIVTSLPLVFFVVSSLIRKAFGLLQAPFFLAPLFVAVAVCLVDLLFLRKGSRLDHANPANSPAEDGP